MADLGNMNLTVGADISGLVKGMQVAEDGVLKFGKTVNQLEDQLKTFQTGLKNATNPESIARLNRAIDETKSRISAINNVSGGAGKGLASIKPGADQAGNSLMNLGRIAQDAPFGFIGIQNNINPLLESFQRLKAETGSTSAAFKALGAGLMGGAGLGLAISLATSVLTVLAQNGFFSAGKQASKAAEEVKKLNEQIKSVSEDAAKEQAQVLVLVKALDSETVSRKDKAAALKDLQSINPKYFGDLRIENDLVVGLTSAYDKYKNSIIASIQNKIDSKKLESVLEKINTLEERALANNFRLKQVEQDRKRLQSLGADPALVAQLDVQKQLIGGGNELNRLSLLRDEILKRIAARNFEGEIKQDLDKTKKSAETINDVLVKLGRELSFLSAKELNLGLDLSKDKVSAISGAIERLIKDFKVDPKDSIINKLFGDIQYINFAEFEKKLKDQARKLRLEPVELPIEPTLNVSGKFDPFGSNPGAMVQLGQSIDTKVGQMISTLKLSGITKGMQDGISTAVEGLRFPELSALYNSTKNKIEDFKAFTKDLFNGAISDSFVQLGSSIGESLSGTENAIGGFFSGIGKILAQSLKDLGKYIITSATLIASIKKALKAAFAGNPVLGIAVGVSLIAIGTALEKNIPGFATGVDNFRGGFAMVGERGPELLKLPKGASITPNDKLGQISGGGTNIVVEVDGILRGEDVVLLVKRVTKKQERTS